MAYQWRNNQYHSVGVIIGNNISNQSAKSRISAKTGIRRLKKAAASGRMASLASRRKRISLKAKALPRS
jgi:hypothetical protein